MTDSVERLNGLLRGEISAVETYNQVLDRSESLIVKTTLTECQLDHSKRVQLLRKCIADRGGSPAEDSGVWGAIARLIEGGAAAFGDKAAIDMLEEGEDHGLDSYKRELPRLDEQDAQLVETQLLPAQEATHRAIRDLKHSFHVA